MKNRNILAFSAATLAVLIMFAGCGEHSGEKEYDKAVAAWKDGDLVRARTLLEKSIRKTSANDQKSTALNQLGLVLWQLGESQAAADAFAKSSNLSEDLSGANLNMGVALYHAGRLDEAEVALNNALGADPANTTAQALLGMLEIDKRDWAGANRELSKAIAKDTRNAAAQNALALAELHQTQDSARALNRLRQLATAYPDYAPAAFNLAAIYDHWLKDRSNALNWYNLYLGKAGAGGTHVDAAKAAIARLGGSAAPVANTTSAANPQLATRYMAEGAKLHGEKKYTEAVAAYRQAIQSDPNQKNAFYNMGLAYYALNDFSEAAKACNDALNIDPAFSDARYMLSLAYAKQKKWNDAEREANELLKTDMKRGEQMIKYISDARKR